MTDVSTPMPSAEGELVLWGRNRGLLWLGVALTAFCQGLALLSTHMLSFTSLVNTLPVLLPSVLGQVMEKHRARRVHVDERGVSIDGRVRLARSNIVSGYLEPLGKSVLVKLQTRFDPVAFAAEVDEEMGQRILHVLGQHAAQRRVLFHGKAIFMRSRMAFWITFVAFLGAMGALCLLSDWSIAQQHEWVRAAPGRNWGDVPFTKWNQLPLFALPVLLPYVIALVTRERIMVGADGVEISTRRGNARFVPYTEIVDVAPGTSAFAAHVLKLVNGEHAKFHPSPTQGAAMIARIKENLARVRKACLAGDVIARSRFVEHDQWIASLRELARATETYRTNAVDVLDLVRVLEDSAQPASKRAAAAFVLKLRVPEEASGRVRVASESTADDDLRLALLDISTGDATAAETALRRVVERNT